MSEPDHVQETSRYCVKGAVDIGIHGIVVASNDVEAKAEADED